MPSKAAKKARRRQSVDRSERVGPTPETTAKLIPCPIQEMYRLGMIDTAAKNAAIELAGIYVAVYGKQMAGARGEGGHHVLSAEIAWKHAHRFLPWSRRWASIKFCRLANVIDVVVFGKPMSFPEVAAALNDYAAISRANPVPPPDKLALAAA